MRRTGTMFYSALLLTGANLALRMVSMGFQVYLSGQIGAAGIGLLQLVMSVSMLAMTAGMGGIRTSTMYLTAEEVGRGRRQGVGRVLSACFLYSFLFSAPWPCWFTSAPPCWQNTGLETHELCLRCESSPHFCRWYACAG